MFYLSLEKKSQLLKEDRRSERNGRSRGVDLPARKISDSKRMPILRFLALLSLLSLVACQNSSWLTLSGNAPVVIAKGGFSGLFPDSSLAAYQVALLTSLPNVILWCDVQLTKDAFGICAPDLKLDNCTNINLVFNATKKTYPVNGVTEDGFFPVDYTLKDLSQVSLTQGIYSRPYQFDTSGNAISTVEQVAQQTKPPGFWLNIQHDLFYREHNLSMRSYVLSVSRRVIVNYISSPEVDFLTSIVTRIKPTKTKLIFRLLGPDDTEPTTNQTYSSLLKNLTFIKTFASGILIPKYYIWPVLPNLYLQPHTSVVTDAHNEGLEVFASDFANDVPLSYNYSFDPVAESLSYIDNGDFSVDGMLTPFPITASEAIGCFAHINKSGSEPTRPIIVSRNGAGGIYAGCTDLAYQRAVDDGADIIDCPVQMTKDGVPVCLNSINLVEGTTVIRSPFNSRVSSIPEILGGDSGIFTFNLTWDEIKGLKPAISTPFLQYNLQRNPLHANEGTFMTLANFLTFAKDKSITGILINIENAAFLAEKLGLSLTESVIDALSKAGYANETHPEVTIQSSNSSVLNVFKQKTKYKRMYMLDEFFSDALDSSVEDIKQFADSVAVRKGSIFTLSKAFITGSTNIVTKLQSFGLKVYVYLLRNEFVSQAWDFFSDSTVEINNFVQKAGVDGVITEFPGTARAYRRNTCLKMVNNTPTYMQPVQVAGLLQLMSADSLPPAQAPLPLLTDSDVVEPPLPTGSGTSPNTSTGGNSSAPSATPSGQQRTTAACILMSLMTLLGFLLLI